MWPCCSGYHLSSALSINMCRSTVQILLLPGCPGFYKKQSQVVYLNICKSLKIRRKTFVGSLTWVAHMPAPTGGQWTAFFVDLQFEGNHIRKYKRALRLLVILNSQDQCLPSSSMGGLWATMERLSSPVLSPLSQIPSLSMNAKRRSAWERLCRSTPTRNTCWQPRNTVGLGSIWPMAERA